MKKITYIILLLLTFNFGYGQTTLSAGDIAITGFNSDDPDQFTFVLLTDVLNTTSINFTDDGWLVSNSFRGSEGTITWTATSDLPCGTEITITDNSPFSASIGTVTDSSSLQLSTSGDQILAYQGLSTSPTFLYAINFDGAGWSNATNANTSALPLGLTNTANAVDVGETDNSSYNCATTSNQLLILSAVSNNSNWNNSNTVITLGGCGYTCVTCPGTTTTWDGTIWDNGTPNLTTAAVINGPYTTNSTNGSFSACSLTINAGRLTIADGYYVEVKNDVIANDELFVSTQGNFVQNSDSATFTDNTTNGVLLSKSKIVQNKFIYTYWSSPIVDETVENVFSTVPADKRFSFNATNFVDLLEEVGNSNPPVYLNNPGIDDIDDNGDDWEFATGIMQPGVGYAMRTNLIGPAFPRQETFIFSGEFNNGVIQVPLVNNSGGQYNDWNFIGNPYPSAINVSQFFTVNAGIVDVVYLWDQATPLGSNTSGNQQYNYSVSDYAMINSSGAISGARSNTGTPPNGSIASGQGFFVEALAASNVTFNNSMRAIGTTDNSQFFKNTKTKEKSNSMLTNKLWVDLSTDNGVYNQILVSYIDNATNGNDGSGYDAKRIVSSGNAAFLYSAIENDNGKFAIQGKAPSDLNENEIINLGFKTSINVATLYTLSIAQLQGDFLSSNTVYLKDNVLNKIHDLSNSDYTFTSEVGEFNNRFQIAFSNKALSTDNISLNDNHLKIVELNNNRVNFKTSENLNIKAVKIYDLLGRELNNLKGNNSSETYELSNLKSNIYIAKVELSNGVTIIKKAIKK